MQNQQTKGANFGLSSVSSNSSGGAAWLGVQNKIQDCFEQFVQTFRAHVDLFFKTYDKTFKDKGLENNLRINNRKEYIKYRQFFVHEEKQYWKEFPRKLPFYHEHLRMMHEVSTERIASAKNSIGTTKDVSLLITKILNILPIASKKYCAKVGLDPVIHSDVTNKVSFDSLTENLTLFDVEERRNWQILGFTVTILATDLINILIDLNQESTKEYQISQGVIELLLEICKHYSVVQIFNEEGSEEDTILDVYFKQIQVSWALIFGKLSKLWFDRCLKFMNQCIHQEYSKLREDEIQIYAQRIYFYRFLQIAPVDKLMANNVKTLLENMGEFFNRPSIPIQMKNVLLMTLKFLIEQLQYFSDHKSAQEQQLMESPIGSLWSVVEGIYEIAEKCRKKEPLIKDYALQLQFVIIKISPDSFFSQKMNLLVDSQKTIEPYFENKKTYNLGLQMIMEISCPRAQPFNKYQNWTPDIYSRSYLLLESGGKDIVFPIKQFKSGEKFKLMRKLQFFYKTFPMPFSDSFQLLYNPKVLPDTALPLLNLLYLKQMSFEDLRFTVEQALPRLLSLFRTFDRYDICLHALKLMDHLLNPKHDFRAQYLQLWQSAPDALDTLSECLASSHALAVKSLKDLLTSQLLKSDFLTDLSNFYKSDEKQLLNDQLSLIWATPSNGVDMEPEFRRATPISKMLKGKKAGRFHLQEEKRQISFEEFREIQMMEEGDGEYQNEVLNGIAKAVQVNEWDYKKEKFIRHRISCHISEEKKEGQRQNTSQFQMSSSKMEEIKLLKQVIQMIHYFPQVHEYFRQTPLQWLLISDHASLVNIVNDMSLVDTDQSVGISPQTPIQQELYKPETAISLRSRRKSGGQLRKQIHPKLRECSNLLPYSLLNTNYDIVITTAREMQKLLVYGDFHTKMSLLDQMLYIIKELMLETPEDFLLPQCLQHLIKMIKVWHASEKNKVKLNLDLVKKRQAEGIDVIATDPLCKFEEEASGKTQMVEYQYIFQAIDMIGLLCMCNKEKHMRQLAVILIAENGKLQRLMIPKDSYTRGIYDIIYYGTESIHEAIVQKMLIVHCMKTGEFRSMEDTQKMVKGFSPYTIIVDNIDYKKSGINEGIFRDMQVIVIGEIFKEWKKILVQEYPQVADSILSFVNLLSLRTIKLFELQNETDVNPSKDYLGFNLLLALTLFNQTITTPQDSDLIIKHEANPFTSDCPSLLSLLSSPLSDTFKGQFVKYYPSKFQLSCLLLSFLYGLSPQPSKLLPLFPLDSNLSRTHNSLIFLTLAAEDTFEEALDPWFASKLKYYLVKDRAKLEEGDRKQSTVMMVCFVHSLVKVITSRHKGDTDKIRQLISVQKQDQVLRISKEEYERIDSDETLKKEIGWLRDKIKEIWQGIMAFGCLEPYERQIINRQTNKIEKRVEPVRLDLKFLIMLESQGYKVLTYYKSLWNNNPNHSMLMASVMTSKKSEISCQLETQQQEFTVNELKLLLNHVYLFYNNRSHPTEQLLKKNTFYRCFSKNIVGTSYLLQYLKDKNFNMVYDQLTSSCLRSPKALIETKLKQFISYGLHTKYFLIGLFMSLNSMNKKVIEESKTLCLSVLPLMFEDERFRETIESMICEQEEIGSLVSFDNKNFFRLLKQVFNDEEAYNMRHHFEKYFSISGLLRNVLNEIIKLQSLHFSQKMLLKILDIVTYFIGTMQLRRAPIIDEKSNSFIFDNLIDYKSFEFLSKLYKISEKLVDEDDESIVMNLWYKVVEGKLHNFEILAKFLVHNLSSYIMKMRAQQKDNHGCEYSLEYEKQKRYSLSIFNYIKARTQQMDLRNSINLSANSVTWSQKMIKLITRSALNLQSKYVLEKVKLKKILQVLHAEINECGLRLQLKGGINQNVEIVNQANQRVSINMSSLLASQTFLDTFSARNRKETSIMKNLMFRIKRIMSDKFFEIAGAKSIEQMPEIIIKYFENSLVFITNDAERPTQVIKFTTKEELSVVIIMIILTLDLMLGERNDNRFYFLLETFNKLSIHVGSVSKYFNFKNFTPQILFLSEQSITTRLWQIVNLKATVEHFAQFTKILFKISQNLNTAPVLQYRLIKVWNFVFLKHKENLMSSQKASTTSSISELIQMKPLDALKYSRTLILLLINNSFYNICQIARVLREDDPDELRYHAYNFKQHFTCILDYVIPSGQVKLHQIQSLTDPESIHVVFASNSIFWIAYSCLECASVAIENQKLDLAADLQAIGMSAITKVLEKSDFLKMLIGVPKLSQNFYNYSISMQKSHGSLLSLIFDAIDNPESVEDAMKCLIISIRVQDLSFLNASGKLEAAELELQRLLFLIPYLMQQFSYIHQQQFNQSSPKPPIFANYRAIILLLKKSLPSIGIDKKKDILEQLDLILKEAEKNEEQLLKREFKGLVIHTVNLCQMLGYLQVIFECEESFISIKEQGSKEAIDKEKIEMVLEAIQECIQKNQLVMKNDSLSFRQQLVEELNQEVYTGEILGEEVSSVKIELRPLYFGLKNIILKEIENMDKEIDIQKFFFDKPMDEANDQSLLSSMQSSVITGFPKRSQTLQSGGYQPPMAKSQSPLDQPLNDCLPQLPGGNFIFSPPPPTIIDQVLQSHEQTALDFSKAVKRVNQKKQENISKYQSSQNAARSFGYMTPSDQRIVKQLVGESMGKTHGIQQESLLLHGGGQSVKNMLNRPIINKTNNTILHRLATHQHSQNLGHPQSLGMPLFEDEDIHMPIQKQLIVEESQQEPVEIPFSIEENKDDDIVVGPENDPPDFQYDEDDNNPYSSSDNAIEKNQHSPSFERDSQGFEVIQEEENEKDTPLKLSSNKNSPQAPRSPSPQPKSPKQDPKQHVPRPNPINFKLNIQPSSSLHDKVVQQQKAVSQTLYTGDEGGIVTFMKPKNTNYNPEPPKTADQKQLKKTDFSALNPNYVAERTSQILSEINESSQYAYSQQNFYKEQDSLIVNEKQVKSQKGSSYRKPLTKYPWIQENQEYEIRSQKVQKINQEEVQLRASNFFDSIKNEQLPTPKKQSDQLESQLTMYLNDKDSYVEFEKFLTYELGYDVDLLHFFVKVIEFKQEIDPYQAYLAASTIIDTFLGDEASSFIQLDQRVIDNAIQEFNRWSAIVENTTQNQQLQYVDYTIFDESAQQIEVELVECVAQFRQYYK